METVTKAPLFSDNEIIARERRNYRSVIRISWAYPIRIGAAVIGVWRKTINTVKRSSTTPALALAEAVGTRGEEIVYQGPEREE
jgi:hypothetical protein